MLAALECVFPVRFERVDSTDLNRSMASSCSAQGLRRYPDRLPAASAARPAARAARLPRAKGCRGCLPRVWQDNRGRPGDEPGLARPLRGRAIPESAVAGELPLALAGGRVLASVEGRPVWRQIGDDAAALGVSAYPLPGLATARRCATTCELAASWGCCRWCTSSGRFSARAAGDCRRCERRSSSMTPISTGRRTGSSSTASWPRTPCGHSYHVGLATVPLDGWLVDRRVGRCSRRTHPCSHC